MSQINKTYLSLLIDVVNKKENLLDQLILDTIKQSYCFSDTDFNDEKYDEIYQKKEALIKEIETLDEGFESLYQRVREEMSTNRYEYEQEIKKLQSKIRTITDRIVRLQKLEADNKVKFDVFLRNKRKQIKDYSVNKRTAAAYYKNMMSQYTNESYLYDRTK